MTQVSTRTCGPYSAFRSVSTAPNGPNIWALTAGVCWSKSRTWPWDVSMKLKLASKICRHDDGHVSWGVDPHIIRTRNDG